jgi:hypothetical protein
LQTAPTSAAKVYWPTSHVLQSFCSSCLDAVVVSVRYVPAMQRSQLLIVPFAVEYLPALQTWHSVSSFSELLPNVPAGHCWHELSTENGFNIGFDMTLPAGQQPSRPVDPEDEENARDHWPPHNVRLKALLLNTGRRDYFKNRGNDE